MSEPQETHKWWSNYYKTEKARWARDSERSRVANENDRARLVRERDEAVEMQKRLSGERHDEWKHKIDALARAEAAEADNAALLGALQGAHACGTDACTRCDDISSTLTQKHPGAALLEERRRLRQLFDSLCRDLDDESDPTFVSIDTLALVGAIKGASRG